MDNLKIGMANCHGLLGKSDMPEFQKLVSNADIFGVCETWLNDGNSSTIVVPGFNFYPLNRKKEKGMTRGGLGVFIKHKCKKHVKVLYDISTENILWCKVSRNFVNFSDDVYIGVVYFPPEYSSREKRMQVDHFQNLLDRTSTIPSDKIILIGDFNARIGDDDDRLLREKHDSDETPTEFFSHIKQIRCNQDKKKNKYGKALLDYCSQTQSYIANGRTLGDFQGKITCLETGGVSTVDYAVLSESLKKNARKFKVLPPFIGSDHCPLKLEISYNASRELRSETLTQMKPKIIWNENTKNMFNWHLESEEMNQEIDLLEKNIEDEEADINSATNKMKKIFMKALGTKSSAHKPKHPRIKIKKWYDKSCQELSKNLKLISYLVSKNPKEPFLRGKLIKTRKEYKKLLKHKRAEYHTELIRKLEAAEENNPKEYWKLIKMLRENRKENKICNTNDFVNFFEKLFSAPNEKDENDMNMMEFVNNILKNAKAKEDFTIEELLKALKILKNNKAAGPDRIPAEALKACPIKFLKVILKLMNKIKNNMQFPDLWAEGITSLLHKDGDDEDPNNYRAITVINTIAKVLAIMINERLDALFEQKKIIKKEQIGFTKKCRPADHLLVVKTLINHYNNNGKKLYACFVDFQKAFDSVWRTGMYYKLIHSGIDVGIIRLLKDMYDKTSQRLKFNNKMSRNFLTKKGVKQGCILSPKLFNIFINDIPDIFDESCCPARLGDTNINCLMYADDLIILSESEKGLQNSLNMLEQYTKKWKLKVNLKKTQIIIFSTGGYKGKTPSFTFEKKPLKLVKEYKYLGTTITNTGQFRLNEVYLKKKGLRASYLLTQSIKNTKISTAIKLFEKIVEPILTYNCEVSLASIPKSWDYSKFVGKMWEHGSEINKVSMNFLRQILGVHKKSSNVALMSETGKHPIILKVYQHIYKYWLRIKDSENPLLKKALETNLADHEKGKNTWYRIINYLETITQAEPSKKGLHKFKENLRFLFYLWWKDETKDKTKLDFYFSFKKNFGFENYLDNNKIRKEAQIAITKLRLSCHCLPIEVLRYSGRDRSDRTCNICPSNKIGDENHYLMECKNKGMVDVRNKFISEVKEICPNFQNFSISNIMVYCLSMHDVKFQVITANFIHDLFKIYKQEDNLPPLQILCLKRLGAIRNSRQYKHTKSQ